MSHHVPARITSFRPSSTRGEVMGRTGYCACVDGCVSAYCAILTGMAGMECGFISCACGGCLHGCAGRHAATEGTSRRVWSRRALLLVDAPALACEPRCALVVVVWLRPRLLMAPGDRVLAAHVVVWLRPRPLMAPGVRVLAALGRADVAPRACASLSLVGSPVSAVPPVGGLARPAPAVERLGTATDAARGRSCGPCAGRR